jgi:predicted secreted hydrolase
MRNRATRRKETEFRSPETESRGLKEGHSIPRISSGPPPRRHRAFCPLASAFCWLFLSFAPARPGYRFQFPGDHGAHPEARLEWWYYTGHLSSRAGRRYGFELTFFRIGIEGERDVDLAHFAISDIDGKTFHFWERVHRPFPGVAGTRQGRLSVWTENWSAEELGGDHILHASSEEAKLALRLHPEKPPVINGQDGVSRKGTGADEASHYVSLTRMAASGYLTTSSGLEPVSGLAWFDHEWGGGALPRDVVGWDWFSLQLSDGADLMIYRMRRRDGTATPYSSGTLVDAEGRSRPIDFREVNLSATGFWISKKSGARYPSGWRILLPGEGLALAVTPLLLDQELVTGGSEGVTYWEGACRISGTSSGRPVTGQSYVELTGYAGPVPGAAAPRQ